MSLCLQTDLISWFCQNTIIKAEVKGQRQMVPTHSCTDCIKPNMSAEEYLYKFFQLSNCWFICLSASCAAHEGSGAPLPTSSLRNAAPGRRSLLSLTRSSQEQMNVYGQPFCWVAAAPKHGSVARQIPSFCPFLTWATSHQQSRPKSRWRERSVSKAGLLTVHITGLFYFQFFH